MLGQDIVQKVRGNVRLYFAGWKVRLSLASRARHTGPRTMHTRIFFLNSLKPGAMKRPLYVFLTGEIIQKSQCAFRWFLTGWLRPAYLNRIAIYFHEIPFVIVSRAPVRDACRFSSYQAPGKYPPFDFSSAASFVHTLLGSAVCCRA